MTDRLCLFACENFCAEMTAAVAAEGWDDVSVVPFPARCGRPPLEFDELLPLLPADCSAVRILGRACLHDLGAPPESFPPTRLAPVTQCFHLVAGEQLVDDAIVGGGYLVTPAWLADWRGKLASMGFTPEQAGEVFQEFAKELVLLDTGLDDQTGDRIKEFEAAVRLPARRYAVGIDPARMRLVRMVLEWRLEVADQAARAQVRHHASELADHVATMDLLTQLAKTQNEDDAITGIEELFRMLFAPAALYYLRVEGDVTQPRVATPEPLLARLDVLRTGATDHAWTPDETGFLLRISHGEAVLGLIAVDGLAFPAYRVRYLNMALTIAGVCGLAIDNARNRKRLLEAEKLASLGIVVAGVAHEVNTPLGVSLTANSSLRVQARHLGERFGARSMTQSDLQQFLSNADASTALIAHNLERIGQLVDAFRQVAVNDRSQESHAVRLANCLNDVATSLGDRMQGIDLVIDCDTDLEIEGLTGDWTSIFTNLISNSLMHGFKGESHGRITVAIRHDPDGLQVDYRDNGVGIDPHTLEHIFDPFFTTNLQQGMGLGMHLVYNLVTLRMHGRILCSSQPGAGMQCLINLPP